MFRKKPLSDAIRIALGVGAGSLALVVAPGASAQDEIIEEIVTTGSRIPVDANLVSKSPVTTMDAADITNNGITKIEDLLNNLPQVVPELTGNDSNGSTGTATLDLRGLGSERTLVLVNGHRMGFGDPFALAPDVNQIPSNLIERVELLTGGASSTYGSDAVAGVVNFIMKKDFEGFKLDYQLSGYSHKNNNAVAQDALDRAGFDSPESSVNDGNATNVNLSFGVNSGDGRGNLTAYLGYREINEIRQGDRDYSRCALSSNSGVNCAGSATLPTGLFTPFDGSFYYTVSGDEFVPWDYTYYNYAPPNFFQRPDERWSGGFFGHQEISEGIEGYAEFMFMDDRSNAQIAPSGAFFVTDTLNCTNAYLSDTQFAQIGCVDPGDTVPLYIGRRNVEGGSRNDDLRHTSMRALVGFRGDIGDNWSWDVSGNWSRMRYSEVYNNDLSTTRIGRAFDAVDDGNGGITCASVIDGSDPSCVPWNVFQEGGVTDAALAYIDLPLFSKADMEMNQVVGYVTGDLGFAIPSADDNVQLVLGAEYRDEKMDYNPDLGYRTGDAAGQGGSTPAVSGGIVVKEVFTEARIPIVQGVTAIDSLTLDLRYRRSDYNTGFDVNTWNVGAEWTPMEGLMFRGGQSQAVRAPNILELFEPTNRGLWGGTDPCGGAAPIMSEADCANTGVQAGQYGTIPLSPAGQYNGVFGGNTALGPETSDSTTLGVVWTPNFLDGLSLTLDYWNIDVQDAISTVDERFTIDQCGASGTEQFCSQISRGPNGNLWLGDAGVLATNVNVGFLNVAGYDFTGIYSMDVGNHGLDFTYRMALVDTWDSQPVPGGDVNDCVGKWGGDCGRPKPEYKSTFTTLWQSPWDLDVVAAWRHIGETTELDTARYTTPNADYFDLSASYHIGDGLGGQWQINAGVTNITDEDPPVNGWLGDIGVYGNGNTIPGQWDSLGRYWFVGFSYAILPN